MQLKELDELGYMGFTIAFRQDKVQVAGTSTTTLCFAPNVVEYLHSIVKSGKITVDVMLNKNED